MYSQKGYYIILVLLLSTIAGGSFYAGTLYQRKSEPVMIGYEEIPKTLVATALTFDSENVTPPPTSGLFVGSKNGTKYYSSPSCGSAKRIKSENYVWFSSAEDAELQGYTRGSC